VDHTVRMDVAKGTGDVDHKFQQLLNQEVWDSLHDEKVP
jgi:hypothetical protein